MTRPLPAMPSPAPARRRLPERHRRMVAAVAALGLVTLAAVACSSSGSDQSADGGSSTAAATQADAPADGEALAPGDAGGLADSDAARSSLSYAEAAQDGVTPTTAQGGDATQVDEPADSRSLIKTGNVALESDDVADTRFEVQKLVDSFGGEVADRMTEAGDDGEEARARLVVRVPVADFDAMMQGLEGIDGAKLLSSNGTVEDVTTQVIDTGVRVALQRRSIQRISVLLDQARSIRDIVNIERELSRREADLGSLEKRQKYLNDQTKMGTITISVEQPGKKKETVVEPTKGDVEVTGFLAGLNGGWHAFTSVTSGLVTAFGALLPFAILLLVIGVPLRFLWRRTATSTPPAVAGADQSA